MAPDPRCAGLLICCVGVHYLVWKRRSGHIPPSAGGSRVDERVLAALACVSRSTGRCGSMVRVTVATLFR